MAFDPDDQTRLLTTLIILRDQIAPTLRTIRDALFTIIALMVYAIFFQS
jgi:hypothetical protein